MDEWLNLIAQANTTIIENGVYIYIYIYNPCSVLEIRKFQLVSHFKVDSSIL